MCAPNELFLIFHIFDGKFKTLINQYGGYC